MTSEGDAWSAYYDQTAGLGAHETLRAAMRLFDRERAAPGFAVDLGCGDGRDTAELIKSGWQVLAIDREPASIERLRARLGPVEAGRLNAVQARFEQVAWPPALLVNASLSLPFCDPRLFPLLWRKIVDSIVPGGRFAGHFLGQNDAWAGHCAITVLKRSELDGMLSGLQVELMEELERDMPLALGQMKHWHLFQVVARKK